MVRPPELGIHASCFIMARLAIVGWMVALIATSVVAAKTSSCLKGSRHCKLQILDVVGSSLAL